MSLYAIALIIGCVAGLRVFIAPAAISWLAYEHGLHLGGSWAGFMSSTWTVGIFTILVLVELVVDQLPSTPSRKVPMQLIPRIISAAFCAVVLATQGGAIVPCVVLGLVGVMIGTFGGYEFRARLAKAFGGKDRPAAIAEDVLALLLVAVVAVML
jgi:uncharacterized membrane protein